MRARSPLHEASLAWQRRRWPTSIKVGAIVLLTILFLSYVDSRCPRIFLDVFRGPDKLHADIFNRTLGVRSPLSLSH